MQVLIIYCHPSANSFTAAVKDAFIKGLQDGNHQYELIDLYQENFHETFSEEEYMREAFYNDSLPIAKDVIKMQEKINQSNVLVFIYPVFWTEAPAKLVGWFQRVWTYGFAYGDKATMKQLEKVLFLVTMGGDLHEELRQRQVVAMKTVMLEDRISNRAKEKEMIVFDRMSRDYPNRRENFDRFLNQAYQLGKEL
ncbi:NAD(P)H-dependent oxidoreductase [uncultured Thomasclavelia sp.]|uniref:NAD(P)H-dependent oxidoreductase n=1 Tax=uncultured Thomasclavelia sp. TaxID=3025759 RepID=UPI0025DA8614|nr:NAD(P)H-dependent oxidoreductase [uncultured Thomasclavelia sp.]